MIDENVLISPRTPRCGVIAMLSIVAIVAMPIQGFTLSFDEAVSRQLAARSRTVCGELRVNLEGDDIDSLDVFEDGLKDICGRGLPDGNGTASSTPGSVSSGESPDLGQYMPSPDISEKLDDSPQDPDVRPKPANAKPEKVRFVTTRQHANMIATYPSGVHVFMYAEFERLDRDVTHYEDGFQADLWGVTFGSDYAFTKWLRAGLEIVYHRQNGSFDGGGEFHDESYGFDLFGLFQLTDAFSLYVTAGYAVRTYDRFRIASFRQFNEDGSLDFEHSGEVKADFTAYEVRGSVLAQNLYVLGRARLRPRLGFDFRHLDAGTYSETGQTGLELTFYDVRQTWLTAQIGLQVSTIFNTRWGRVFPWASVDSRIELKNDQRTVQASFVDDTRDKRFEFQTQSPDRLFFEVRAGSSIALTSRLFFFVNYRGLIGHQFFTLHGGAVGFRIGF